MATRTIPARTVPGWVPGAILAVGAIVSASLYGGLIAGGCGSLSAASFADDVLAFHTAQGC